jgi:hypothetical protein
LGDLIREGLSLNFSAGTEETLKQQNTFNYLGYNISHEGEKDLNIKAANFGRVLGIITGLES